MPINDELAALYAGDELYDGQCRECWRCLREAQTDQLASVRERNDLCARHACSHLHQYCSWKGRELDEQCPAEGERSEEQLEWGDEEEEEAREVRYPSWRLVDGHSDEIRAVQQRVNEGCA